MDASVVLPWFLEDERSDYADSVLASLEDAEATVPCLWYAEVTNALVVAERRKRTTVEQVDRFVGLLMELSIVVGTAQPSMPHLLGVCRDQHLSSYDATYLDLAHHLRYPLATLDTALQKAATRLKIKLYEV